MKQETIDMVLKFRDDRNWKQFHTPKDLAISLSLEAAELLEVFQWSGTDLECKEKRDKIEEELADVLSYCFLLADVYHMNLDEIVRKKVKTNEVKYPVSKAYGRSDKYTVLAKEITVQNKAHI